MFTQIGGDMQAASTAATLPLLDFGDTGSSAADLCSDLSAMLDGLFEVGGLPRTAMPTRTTGCPLHRTRGYPPSSPRRNRPTDIDKRSSQIPWSISVNHR